VNSSELFVLNIIIKIVKDRQLFCYWAFIIIAPQLAFGNAGKERSALTKRAPALSYFAEHPTPQADNFSATGL
jgi:hypothetical protein